MDNQIELSLNLYFDLYTDDNVWDRSVFQVYRAALLLNKKEIGYMKIVVIPQEKKLFSTFQNYSTQWHHITESQEREQYQINKKFFHKKALIAYSNIDKEFQGQGYGRQMYILVNDKVKEMGYMLGSDTCRTPEANRLWNKLISLELAYFENRRYYLK